MIKLRRPECPNPQALAANNYKHPENKEALRKANSGKCMYCESDIGHIDYAHVEHIKPKAPDKYPELEFVWENLGYSCPKCNLNKSDKYFDATPFVDPYVEDPELYTIVIGTIIVPLNGSDRGEVTIREINLNRPELCEKRSVRFNQISKGINSAFRFSDPDIRNSAIAELLAESDPSREYSRVAKSLFKAMELL